MLGEERLHQKPSYVFFLAVLGIEPRTLCSSAKQVLYHWTVHPAHPFLIIILLTSNTCTRGYTVIFTYVLTIYLS
jgi:hypothetical protein